MTVVNIIGGGLYGVITAVMLAMSDKNSKVRIIDAAPKLLSSFESIFLGGEWLNNGFHGMEFPRAGGLISFLRDDLQVPLRSIPNQRVMSIDGTLVNFEAPFVEWPEAAKTLIKNSPKGNANSMSALLSCLSPSGLELITTNARRYGDVFEHVQHLMVPWFLPSDFTMSSDDEGDNFRAEVRAGNILPQYFTPQNGLFSSLREYLEERLKDIGVELFLGVKVAPDDDGLTYWGDDGRIAGLSTVHKTVFAMSSTSLLAQLAPDLLAEMTTGRRLAYNALYETKKDISKFKNVSEVLSLSSSAPQFGRISFPSSDSIGERFLIQAEVFLDSSAASSDGKYFSACHIESICDLAEKSVSLIDYAQTRTTFAPDPDVVEKSKHKIKEWVAAQNSNILIEPFFNPINMSKTYHLASKFVGEINR